MVLLGGKSWVHLPTDGLARDLGVVDPGIFDLIEHINIYLIEFRVVDLGLDQDPLSVHLMSASGPGLGD